MYEINPWKTRAFSVFSVLKLQTFYTINLLNSKFKVQISVYSNLNKPNIH